MRSIRQSRIVLRRHAERPPNEVLARKGDVGVTLRGRRHAKALGRSLRNQGERVDVYTTDRLRAVQSARGLARGAGQKKDPVILPKLTSLIRPEAKTRYRAELMELSRLTNEQILSEWIHGRINPKLVYSPMEEVEHVIHYVKDGRLLTGKGTRTEVITHDSTLLAFAHIFIGEIPTSRHTRSSNPSQIGYLEGMHLIIEPGKVKLRFRKRTYDITKQFNEIAKRV